MLFQLEKYSLIIRWSMCKKIKTKKKSYLPTMKNLGRSTSNITYQCWPHGKSNTIIFFLSLNTMAVHVFQSYWKKVFFFYIYRNKQIGYIFKSISEPVYSFSSRWENFQVFILWEVFMWRWSVWAPSKLPAVRFWDIQM